MNNRHLRFGFPPRRTPPDPLCPASFGGLEDRTTPNSCVTQTGHETSKDEPAMPIRACEWCSAPIYPATTGRPPRFFASTSDPAALQAICDAFTPGTVQVWFERWMARLPLPLGTADRDAGFWWELSMRQIETSRTLVFDQDVHARAFFEALLRDNMDLGRPENVELLFRRGQRSGRPTNPPDGGFETKIDRHCDLVTPQRVLQKLPLQAVPQLRHEVAR